MKRFGWVLSAVAVLMLTVVAPAAKKEEGAKKGKPDKAARGEKPEKGKGGRAALSLGAMEKVLDLNEDQKAAMKERSAEGKKAMAAWMKGEEGQKLKELMTQLKEARKAKQTEDIKALTAEMKELMKPRQQIMAETKAAVLEVLTEEQQAKWKEYIASKKKRGPKKDGDAPKKSGKKPKGGKKNKGGEEPAPE